MKRRRVVLLVLLCALLPPAYAQAPASAPVRIRGVVLALDGQVLSIKANDGVVHTVRLADNFMVMGITRATIDDIASGKFIGTTTLGERDGALVALEVHIFPDALRGTGEGHYDWDLRPASKMTNANVATVTRMGQDRVLEVKYKDGEKRVLVPESAVIVAFTPVERASIKPGAAVFVNAQRQGDGSLAAARVNVGINGQMPPM